jgi:hypothetical protein
MVYDREIQTAIGYLVPGCAGETEFQTLLKPVSTLELLSDRHIDVV